MPHQLRRIIGINLRNPKSDLPSLHIAELNPRGGIIAAGENGVGKTTFLRLLPLFYGATPTQILRGTGLVSLVKHTLPDPSSAVAYEYERHTEEEVRCVVMHCHPDKDAPQFMIVEGPFEQRFFVDEQGEFVRREEFKARVEAMGFAVSRILSLSEWRAVVLKEGAQTKDSAQLRDLAHVHSLGPKSLHGLDQIAASMANERLSFRDLQNIVLDRVMDSRGEDAPKQNTRELKQSREAVTGWLENREHLVRLRDRRPDARKLREMCEVIRTNHHQLCAIHAAVKELLLQMEDDARALTRRQTALREEFSAFVEDQKEVIAGLKGAEDEALVTFRDIQEVVSSTAARLKEFNAMGVEAMASAQDGESALQRQRLDAEQERNTLNEAAGGVAVTHEAKVRRIEESFATESGRISADRVTLADDSAQRQERIRIEENAALTDLAPPARLSQLPAARAKATTTLAELRYEQRHPLPDAKAAAAVTDAEGRAAVARQERDEAENSRRAADKEAATARRQHDDGLTRLAQAQSAAAAARATIDAIEAQMTPPKGSLLEYLRSQPAETWAAASRVLDLNVTLRTDLAPDMFDVGQGLVTAESNLMVGSLQLDVRQVPVPGWVDMQELRTRLAKAQSELGTVNKQESDAKSESGRLLGAFEQAIENASRAAAHSELAREAVVRAESDLRSAKSAAGDQVAERVKVLRGLIEAAQAALTALDDEENALRQQAQQAIASIRAGFENMRLAATADLAAATQRLNQEADAVAQRRKNALAEAEAERDTELAAAGVDPARVQKLTEELSALAKSLDGISRNRHHVKAWREFQVGLLPALPANKIKLEQASQALAAARDAHNVATEALASRARAVDEDVSGIETSLSALATQRGQLQGLLDQGLDSFVGPVTKKLSRQWTPEEIIAAVESARMEIYRKTEEVNNLRRSLRNVMTQVPGSVDDWVTELDKQIAANPEQVLVHQEACNRADEIARWFETEYGQPVMALNDSLARFLDLAGNFVRSLEGFDRRISHFNRELQGALRNIAHFERFGDLSVVIKSSVNQIGYLQVLREMQLLSDSRHSTLRSSSAAMARDFELPSDEVVGLIRSFRDMLQREGGVRVNLADQVQIECSLTIDSKSVVITNEDEFRARASNGNNAVIMALFLLGFAAMVRQDAPVRLTWVTDEISRVDGRNLAAFLQTLQTNSIDVISAAPSGDPSILALFARRCIFENTGAIRTHQPREAVHV